MDTIEVLPIRVRVTAILRKALLAGEFPPGAELSLTETASRLGVSRTPVREAFQSLANEGLLELRMNRGAIVVGIDETFIRDHFDLRTVLEREAVVRAVERNINLAPLLELQDQVEANPDISESDYRSYNRQLHTTIWQAADNQKLCSLLTSLWNGPSSRSIGQDRDHEKQSIQEHRRMLSAMVSHDAQRAGDVMAEHIQRSKQNILTSFRLSRKI